MKTWLILILVLSGCATPRETEPIRPTKNLTEGEIRSLPAGTTFDQIVARLKSHEGFDILIPAIFFTIEEQDNQQCVMEFDEKTGLLLFAAMGPTEPKEPEKCIMIWPRNIADKKMSDYLAKLGDKMPNQSPETTTMAVTPAASHPSRQP